MKQLTNVCAYICLSSIIHAAFCDSCDFLFECSQWTHDKYWTRVRYGQINDNMPKTDHTSGNTVGFYLYFNNTTSEDQIVVAKLQSKALNQPHTCLIFWYSMYESDVQYLKVFRISDNSKTEIWNKTGNLLNVWNEAKVEFSYGGEFILVIEGTKTTTGHMALDDITVTGVCSDITTGTQSTTEARTSIGNRDSTKNQLSYTCTFQDGLCSWAQVTFDDFNWTRTSGSSPTSHIGPGTGHSTDNDIFYLYIDASKQINGEKAILRHTWLYGPGRACLSFWYSMYGISMGTLSVNLRLKNDTLLPVWSKTGNRPKGWILSNLDLEVGPEISIEFEAIRGSGSTSNIALDDVSLTSKSCFDCSFDEDACYWMRPDENWKLSLDEANGGKYIHSAESSQCTSNLSFVAPFLAMRGSFCFSFLYFLKGSNTTKLQLYSYTWFNNSLIWRVTGSTNSSWSLVSIFLESIHSFTLEFKMYPSDCMGQAGLDNISVERGQCQDIESRTEILPTTGKMNGPTVKIGIAYEAAISGTVVGSLVFLVVLVLVAVCICRRKQCSKERNEGNTILQLPSYETLQHGGNTVDYLHVVNRPSHSSTQYSNVPFPHNIIRNNDNEYDYVS